MELTKGTRVYFNGDMANASGFGTITEEIPASKYAPEQVRIKFDDGREMVVMKMGFSKEYKGHGGTRFVTEEAYKEYRRKALEAFMASVRK